MIKLELTLASAELLQETLGVCLSELRFEIAGTDSKDFRDDLKARKLVLIEITEQLRRQMPHTEEVAAL